MTATVHQFPARQAEPEEWPPIKGTYCPPGLDGRRPMGHAGATDDSVDRSFMRAASFQAGHYPTGMAAFGELFTPEREEVVLPWWGKLLAWAVGVWLGYVAAAGVAVLASVVW